MKTKIIADLTSNHMGEIEVLNSMIQSLADNKIDCVKLQSWQADKLRKDISNYDVNYAYYTKHQLSDDDHFKIKELCDKVGIEMLTTCFDLERIEFLSKLGLNKIKIASSDMASYKLIEQAIEKFDEVIISTGAATEEEMQKTFEICRNKKVTFLHCVTEYPCPLNNVNMKRMFYFRDLGFKYGYSDHTLGTEAGKYAICLGAKYVEKHFTLNRYLPGKDQKMSATIDEMSELVKWANLVQKMEGKQNFQLSEVEKIFRKNYIGKWGNNQ